MKTIWLGEPVSGRHLYTECRSHSGRIRTWTFSRGTNMKIGIVGTGNVRRALAEATAERQPEWRATPNSPGTYDSPA
jgi:hypothetical protein